MIVIAPCLRVSETVIRASINEQRIYARPAQSCRYLGRRAVWQTKKNHIMSAQMLHVCGLDNPVGQREKVGVVEPLLLKKVILF